MVEQNEDEMSRDQWHAEHRLLQRPPSHTRKAERLRACLGIGLLLVSFAACGQVSVKLTREQPSLEPTIQLSPTPAATQKIVPLQTPSIGVSVAAVGSETTETPEPAETPVAAASGSATTTASVAPTAVEVNSVDQFASQVDALLADVPAHIGIVVARPDGTVFYQQEADTLFESASLYKLAIMAEIYRERDAGDLTFDESVTLYPGFFSEDDSVYGYDLNAFDQIPVGTLLDNMIMLSSNVAANALLYLAGTDRVNQMAESIGMPNTKILWYPSAGLKPNVRLVSYTPGESTSGERDSVDGAYNVTTAADIAVLFERLVQGQVVSPETSAEMLDLLAQQEINDRLPALLPTGTRVAHKTGDLDYSIHDAGVIYGPNGPVVVTVLSDDVENREAVVDFIQQVARLAYALPSD